MRLFLEDFDSIEPDIRKRLLGIVEKQWSWRDDLLWHQEEPWFDTRDVIPFLDFSSYSDEVVAKAQETLRSLSPGEKLPPEQIWNLLRFFVEGRRTSKLEMLEQALSYDEALIRGQAAFLLFRDHAGGSRELLERIAGDPDPMVIAEALSGMLKQWESYQASVLKSAVEILLPALSHPSRAILAFAS